MGYIKDGLLFWTPRVLVLAFTLFLSIFSLDVFESSQGFWQTLLALFMHNLPSFVLLIILLISWKHELFGAIIFGALGIISVMGITIISFAVAEGSRFNPILMITGIISIIVGILFFIGSKKKK